MNILRGLADRVYLWQMRRYYLKNPPFAWYLDLYPPRTL